MKAVRVIELLHNPYVVSRLLILHNRNHRPSNHPIKENPKMYSTKETPKPVPTPAAVEYK
jgi:hypothetical protein